MNIMKRAAAVLALAAMWAAAAASAAAADGAVVDPAKKGSLTLYKIEENSAATVSNGGRSAPVSAKGMKGIVFSALKIGEMEMVPHGSDAGTYFAEVDEGFLTLASDAGAAAEPLTVNGKECYRTEDLTAALKAINNMSGDEPGEVRLASYVKGASGKLTMPATDGNGKSTLADMSLGLYLVAETDSSGYEGSGAIHRHASPFLVSLPSTAENDSGELEWIYDIIAYPKNQTVTIRKYLVEEGGSGVLKTSDDHEIGEVFTQVIATDAPAVPDLSEGGGGRGEYEFYEVKDVMEKGLSFKKIRSVRVGSRVSSPENISDFSGFAELAAGVDYEVLKGDSGNVKLTEANAAGTKVFRVRFLKEGLAKLSALKTEGQTAVIFDAVVTKDAEDGGGDPNRNTPSASIKTGTSKMYNITGNIPEVFTYRLKIKKTGLTDPSKAGFRVKRGGDTVRFVMESDGIYHMFDADMDEAGKVASHERIRPNASGELVIRGLDDDDYEFTEVETEDGHELLKSSFTVTLKGNVPPDGKLKSAGISSDGAKASLKVSAGTASLGIKNSRSLILKTGGAGTTFLYIIGALLICGSAAFALIARRNGR